MADDAIGGRTRIAESTWDWALFKEPDGRLVLSVVCGTVGLWEVEVELGPELRAAYQAEGLEPIRRFAREVSGHPSRFRNGSRSP